MDKSKKKIWTQTERLELATKLDNQLKEYISNLEKRSNWQGWSEDKWEEEMEKHPFFMKKAPEPGEKLSPLMEGLMELKYGEDENTPEELANNYKEDGNFNFKHKKYRLAILSYTEGIRTKCKDDKLMAQLYNNRSAAHFTLQNFRSSLNDCNSALKLIPSYWKAIHRAASCSYYIHDYDQCTTMCDKFLKFRPYDKEMMNLRMSACQANQNALMHDRKEENRQRKLCRERVKLLTAIRERGISLEREAFGTGRRWNLEVKEPQVSNIVLGKVHFDKEDKLVWPVMILYPEVKKTDYIQNCHEDIPLVEQLTELFDEAPPWDAKCRYTIRNISVYFEGKNSSSMFSVDIQLPLKRILQHQQFIVRGGTPAFLIFVGNSEAEKYFLRK